MAESFYWKIQKLLLKKEQEYGQLKFIASRATKETSDFIDKLVQEIIDIAHTFQMQEISEDNNHVTVTPLIALYYNYFLLNTNFSTQDLFTEDLTYGHIVGVWPPLSPYLFIQIIWRSKCEAILAESLTYVPLDLCVDILEITIKSINELEIERAMNLIIFLIYKVYDKCLLLQQSMLSAGHSTELVCQLVANFQTLLDLLVSPKFADFTNSSDEVKYKHRGVLLKRILRLIKKCMKRKIASTINQCTAKLLTLTYGNPNGRPIYNNVLSVDKVKSTISTMDQDLVNLLLNQIKKIDCYEYMGWAEIDDKENVMISLQRAIIIECHYFMRFMEKDDFLMRNDHLRHCLQQLTGVTNSEQAFLTLQEICHGVNNDRPEAMRELMRRYREWDYAILEFIEENAKLLMMDDCCILLEYLHHISTCSHFTEQEKYNAYILVLKVILQQNAPNMYVIIQKYVLQHFNDNRLTYLYNEELFKSFMARNLNMRDPQVLRILLVFILLDAKTVLTVLVRIVIGCKDYANIVFTPNNMLLLRPFLCVNMSKQHSILTYILKDVSLEDTTWSCKNFSHFVNIMLDNQVITADDLINNVYIPYLIGSPFYYFNLVSILLHIYDTLRVRVTYDINYTLLTIVLVKRMSMIRKCEVTCLRAAVNDLIKHIMCILNYLNTNLLTANQKRDVINEIANCVEPIDRAWLGFLECKTKSDIIDIIQDYERRCFIVHRQLRTNSRCDPELREYARSFQLNRETFIIHMILHSTEDEYDTFLTQLTLVYWCHFGWETEMQAYENVLRITGQAIRMVLIFKETFPVDMFVALLRAVLRFCNKFAHILNFEPILDKGEMPRILLEMLSSLKEPASRTCFKQMYSLFVARISNIRFDASNSYVKYFNEINEWLNVYLVHCDKLTTSLQDCESSDDETNSVYTCQYQTSEEIHMLQVYKFVCECIRVSNMNIQFYMQLIQNVISMTE